MNESIEKKLYSIHTLNEMSTVHRNEIIYIESYGRKIHFYVKDEIYTVNSKLDEVERCLNDRNFLRIHKSFLINMRFIEKMKCYQVYLKTGFVLPISKARYIDVRETYLFWKELFVD